MLIPKETAKLSHLIGAEAPLAYREVIMAYDNILTVTICHYGTPPLLQERITITAVERSIIDGAMTIREDARIPFWEALFSSCLRAGICPDSLLKAAGFHQWPGELIPFTYAEVEKGILADVLKGGQRNTGITSRVTVRDGEDGHLALMDFHCELTEANTEIVAAVCRRLMPHGFILLDSGDSYHACGLGLLSDQERIDFLAQSLFFSPIVDSAYVAHQLLQSMSTIRISTGGSRNKRPEVLLVEC